MKSIKFFVRVNCLTYNHAPYIVDAMNGFTMQQTSFPFVCIIVDDASTDGEPEVVTSYMRDNFDLADKTIAIEEETDDYRLMYARHNSNQNCYFVAILLKYNHYSINKPKHPYYLRWVGEKYLAICEGDDYWIDPLKLQKQVNFMESHPDYSLCFSNVYRKDSDLGKYVRPFNQTCNNEVVNGIDNSKDLFYALINRDCRVPTLTALYRPSVVEQLQKEETQTFMMGDTPLWIRLSQCGKFKYFEDVFGVYCIHQGSATHNPKTRLGFTLNAKSMCVYYCNKYNYDVPRKLKDEYNRAYLQMVLNFEDPKPFAIQAIFPNAIFGWAVDKEGQLKYKKKSQLFIIKAFFYIENFIYENKIRLSLWLNNIIKRK